LGGQDGVVPLGIAGLYTSWRDADGIERHRFAMLTVNAEGQPVFGLMHKPGRGKAHGDHPGADRLRRVVELQHFRGAAVLQAVDGSADRRAGAAGSCTSRVEQDDVTAAQAADDRSEDRRPV